MKSRKKVPKKRLTKKRRLKSTPNIARKAYVIIAQKGQGRGPRMHYDGTRFSQRKERKLFATANAARDRAKALIRQYPVLRNYRITVEDTLVVPIGARKRRP